MSYIDKITVDEVTYDLQDTALTTSVANIHAETGADILYAQIFGNNDDWSLTTAKKLNVTKTGRKITFNGTGTNGSTYQWIPLTGTLHTGVDGTSGTSTAVKDLISNGGRDGDFIDISAALASVFDAKNSSNAQRIVLKCYCDFSLLPPGNPSVYFRLMLRRYNTETEAYEYTDWYSAGFNASVGSMTRMYSIPIVVHPMASIVTIGIAAADWANYDQMAIYVQTYGQSTYGTILLEPVAEQTEISFDRGDVYGMPCGITTEGITIVKTGNRVLINGTKTGNYARNYYITRALGSTEGNTPPDNSVSPTFIMKAGRKYKLTAVVESGTFENGESGNLGNIRWYTRPLANESASVTIHNFTADIASTIAAGTYVIDNYYTPTEDQLGGFGFYIRVGNVFDNFAVRFFIQDAEMARNEALAPYETTTASQSYAAGSLLTKNGLLYQASTAIGAGESITPGTNVVETSVAELLTPEAGTITYESNSYVNSGMASASWLKVYPFGLAVLFLFIPVATALPSDGTNITTGRVSHPPLANFGQGMSANDPSLGIVANISTDGTIQVYTKGASKPSSGWGTYSAMICYPITPFHP